MGAYEPDLLAGTHFPLPPDVVDQVATATAALTTAGLAVGQADLDSFASLTLRSEAVASSVIEGVAVSATSVALADFSGFGSQAALARRRPGTAGGTGAPLGRPELGWAAGWG